MILEMFERGEYYLNTVINELVLKNNTENLSEEEEGILSKTNDALDKLLKEKEELGDLVKKIDALSKRRKVSVIPISAWDMKENGYYICFDSFVLKIQDTNFQLFPHLKATRPSIKTVDGIAKFVRRG